MEGDLEAINGRKVARPPRLVELDAIDACQEIDPSGGNSKLNDLVLFEKVTWL